MALSFGFAFLFEGADFDLRQQRNPEWVARHYYRN
jgi:hypothetical protein